MTEPRTVILSPNQHRAVSAFLHDGADTRTIARRLGISDESAKNHMREVLRRAGCHPRAELAVEVLRGRVRLEAQDRRVTA